jgi:hypothetical protein
MSARDTPNSSKSVSESQVGFRCLTARRSPRTHWHNVVSSWGMGCPPASPPHWHWQLAAARTPSSLLRAAQGPGKLGLAKEYLTEPETHSLRLAHRDGSSSDQRRLRAGDRDARVCKCTRADEYWDASKFNFLWLLPPDIRELDKKTGGQLRPAPGSTSGIAHTELE